MNKGEIIYRPTLPITLRYGRITIPVSDALVDTGADQTLLPLAFAIQFGFRFDLLRDGVEWSGAGGGKFRVFPAPKLIEFILEQRGFRSMHWTGFASFTLDQPTILLGHRGCLDNLDLLFRGKERTLEVHES